MRPVAGRWYRNAAFGYNQGIPLDPEGVMTFDANNMQAVLGRLEKLERQNRWLMRVGFVVTLLVIARIAVWGGRRTHRLEAEEFVLRDARGIARARLAVNGDFTDLSLFGENERGIATLSASEHGGQVHLLGPGKAFATLDVTDSIGSGLHLHHANSWAGVLAAQDSADLTLSTPEAQASKVVTMQPRAAYPVSKGAGSATVGVDQDGPYLNLQDKRSFQATVGSIALTDATSGRSSNTSAASLLMFGRNGKVIWRAP
jgi:hypothetical protein